MYSFFSPTDEGDLENRILFAEGGVILIEEADGVFASFFLFLVRLFLLSFAKKEERERRGGFGCVWYCLAFRGCLCVLLVVLSLLTLHRIPRCRSG